MATGTATKRKVVSLDEIKAADDLRRLEVDMPEWGGVVVVRGLTLQEARDIQRDALQGGEIDEAKVMVGTIAAGVVDPPISREDANHLMLKRAGNVVALVLAINSLTGTSPEEVDATIARFRKG